MLQTRVRFTAVVAVIVLTALPVAATPQPRKTKLSKRAVIASQARELRGQGIVELNLGRYDEAVKLLEQAYESSRDPSILFDLVQAHRLNGNPERALLLCASFLRTARSLTRHTREQVERSASELGIIIEQLQLQRNHVRLSALPSAKEAAKEETQSKEPPSIDQTSSEAVEPPATKAAGDLEKSENKGVVAGAIPASAAKEVESAATDRSAELLKSETLVAEAKSPRPFYKNPWVWTAAGVVFSGVAALIVYESSKDPGPPRTSWGAVRVF